MKKESKNRFGPVFDKWMNDPEFRKDYDKEFREFALSELMLTLMEGDRKSVRKLAELAGLNPSTIQDLRSGKSKDVGLKNFIRIAEACGYSLELVKDKNRVPLHSSRSGDYDFAALQ